MKEHGEEEGTYNEYISSDDNLDDNAATRPQIMIQYVSCEGLEDFWTYHQHDIGRAGIGYVNDYNAARSWCIRLMPFPAAVRLSA